MRYDDLDNEVIDLLIGTKFMGWVIYPDDSVERGTVYHQDKDRAPFGKLRDVDTFKPTTNFDDWWLVIQNLDMTLDVSGDVWYRVGKKLYHHQCESNMKRASLICILKSLDK